MAGQGRESRLWTVTTMHLVQRAPSSCVMRIWLRWKIDGSLIKWWDMNMLKFIRVRVYIGKMEALKRYLDEKYRYLGWMFLRRSFLEFYEFIVYFFPFRFIGNDWYISDRIFEILNNIFGFVFFFFFHSFLSLKEIWKFVTQVLRIFFFVFFFYSFLFIFRKRRR